MGVWTIKVTDGMMHVFLRFDEDNLRYILTFTEMNSGEKDEVSIARRDIHSFINHITKVVEKVERERGPDEE